MMFKKRARLRALQYPGGGRLRPVETSSRAQRRSRVRPVLDPYCGIGLLLTLDVVQATEPIADFAVAHRKPFAIIPCCVFPR